VIYCLTCFIVVKITLVLIIKIAQINLLNILATWNTWGLFRQIVHWNTSARIKMYFRLGKKAKQLHQIVNCGTQHVNEKKQKKNQFLLSGQCFIPLPAYKPLRL